MISKHPRLYSLLFKVWHWYALKILRIPFILAYNPPPDGDLMAVTYSWTKDYTERVMRTFYLDNRVDELTRELAAAQARLVALEDNQTGDSHGSNDL